MIMIAKDVKLPKLNDLTNDGENQGSLKMKVLGKTHR